MPPKPKFNAEDIIEVAFNIVRWNGWEALSARAVAEELNSSTMPVYFHFKSMENLEEEIVKKALALLLEYQNKITTGDVLLDFGVGYVSFSREEQHLFKGIIDRKYSHLLAKHGQMNFDFLTAALARDDRFKRFSQEELRKILFVLWVFIHGLAQLSNSIPLKQLEEFDLPNLLKTTSSIFVKGLDAFMEQEQGGL
ncbi:MAG: TetR/AcrR family transcriptional regulator [Pseudomonadota bacterium]